MLGHLATNQRTTALAATLCNTTDNLGNGLSFKLAHGYVIQEEQRLSAHGDNVINAHCNQVLAHRVVAVEQLRNGKLGSNAVSAADQHGLLHVLQSCGREAGAKAAQAADDLGASSCSNSSFDGVNRASALINVNACVGVGNLLGWISGSGHCFSPYCSEGIRPSSINCCSTWSNFSA